MPPRSGARPAVVGLGELAAKQADRRSKQGSAAASMAGGRLGGFLEERESGRAASRRHDRATRVAQAASGYGLARAHGPQATAQRPIYRL